MDSTNADINDEWMLPSEALTRHIPPVGVLFSDFKDEKTETRYGFVVGTLGYLIAKMTPSEVITNPVIYKLPTFSKFLVGVTNQRGNIVPVFDFHSLLDEDKPETGRVVLVLGQGSKVAGIMIDNLPQTVQVTDTLEEHITIPDSFKPYIEPAFTNNGRTWAEFDYENLLLDSASGMLQPDAIVNQG